MTAAADEMRATMMAAIAAAPTIEGTATRQADTAPAGEAGATEAAAPDPMQRPLWEIDPRFLDPTAPLPPLLTWGTMAGRPAIPTAGLITFSAKPKQGKSLSASALVMAMLTGRALDSFTPAEPPRLVIVFDTEMDRATLLERVQTMRSALGDAAPRFQIVPLVEEPKSRRRGIIEEMITQYRPDIVVLDQIARLVENFNDAPEATALGEWLLPLASRCTIIAIIHQNKAADNAQMKGHLGSILEELAVENYRVERKEGLFKIIPTNSRKTCVDSDTAPVVFAIDDNGQFISGAAIQESNRAKEVDAMRAAWRDVFGDAATLTRNEIINRLINTAAAAHADITPITARRRFDEARAAGVIEKTAPDKRAPYRLAPPRPAGLAQLEIDPDDDL